MEEADGARGVPALDPTPGTSLRSGEHARNGAAFSATIDSVLSELDTHPDRGLTDREIRERQRRYGRNVLRHRQAKAGLSILIDQFRGVIVWLLALAAALAFYLADWAEGVAILVVLAINGAIGFFTELRAVRSMEALRRLAQVKTRVRRSGETRVVDAREIVPGDIIVIEAGDIVTADLRLLEAARLQCDESTLTGESAPVEKDIEALDPDTPLADRKNMAFKGTAIARGSGKGVAVTTGMATELGRISKLAEEAAPEVSPLEKRLDQLGHRLVWLTLLLAAATALAGIARGHDHLAMIETAIALAVAAVPEGLPIVATLCLARGIWRMAARNALIARLSAVETLGATTLILTDKTGTLTENRMSVARYILSDGEVDVTADDNKQPFSSDGAAIDPGSRQTLSIALRVGVLCNNAELPSSGADDKDERGIGDPMEIALLAAARLGGLEQDVTRRHFRESKEHAFDPDLKMMATVHAHNSAYFYAVKGAPEKVLERCNDVLTAEGRRPLQGDDRHEWSKRARAEARRGYRILALAFKHHETPDVPPYEDLTLSGLVCLLDPLRGDIREAISACRDAGVRVVMLTGDHADTAAEIARQAGLGSGELRVIEGQELLTLENSSPDTTLRERLLVADVFARVSPEMKLRLASLFQTAGEVVAMTGDGVNDAPALKKADIGIAMGQRGTEVAREAAHMVLKDDAFSTIVVAMREGRVILSNIRKFVVYLMSCNVSEALVVGLAVFSGLPMPLLPLQILYLNLVTDVFPAFALSLGEADDQVMRQKPRDPQEPIIDRARWVLIGALGSLITLATLGSFSIGLYVLELPADQAITIAFLTLAAAQLWNVFNMRTARSRWFANEVVHNRYVWGALALCCALIAGAILLPNLSELMRLPYPGLAGLVLALAASFVPLFTGQAMISVLARRFPSLDRT